MNGDDLQQRRARIERLRRLGVQRGTAHLAARPAATPTPAHNPLETDRPEVAAPAEVALPGRVEQTPYGPAWVREKRYPVEDNRLLGHWLQTDPECLAALDRNPALAAMDPATVAFVDTETTGLSLGAGTYTFLIGIGMFEPPAVSDSAFDSAFGSAEDARSIDIDLRESILSGGPYGPESKDAALPRSSHPSRGWHFVVRQVFMRHPGEERAQLHIVEELLGRCTGIVSFNGRGFDMPLINNRFILAEMPPPLLGAPHLDLLPPARRLYRLRWGACNLGALERNVLGLERSAEDVPGYLIPDIYRQYYLTGVATDMLARVFYHNLQDVASMALLGARMARCFRRDLLATLLDELHPLECLSLGRCYDALQWTDAGIVVYRAAAATAPSVEHQAMAFRELAVLYKRLNEREQAAALWETWITTLNSEDLTPYVELAKHHEWHTGDLPAARGWAGWALSLARGMARGLARDQWVADLERRLARIEAKLAQREAAGQT